MIPQAQNIPSIPANTPPLISVIIACLNSAKTLRQSLESVVSQKGKFAELIVMDGGSTDGTLAILEEYQSQFAYWTSARDGGVYQAWNKALDRTQGEWIYFLGADDVLRTDTVLEDMSRVLLNSPNPTQVVYGRVAVLDEDGGEVTVAGRPWAEVAKPFFCGRNLYHQGVFHHRSLFSSRRFDPSFRIFGDYELLLGALSAHDPIFAGEVVVAGFRAGGLSNRPQLMFRAFREVNRALRMHGYSRGAARFLTNFLQTSGWYALLSLAGLISSNLRKRLSRVLVQRASREL